MIRSQLLAAAAGMGRESRRVHAAISATLAVAEIRVGMTVSVIDPADHTEMMSNSSSAALIDHQTGDDRRRVVTPTEVTLLLL
jgi:hypothetical protein